MSETEYTYGWRNNEVRKRLFGRPCKIRYSLSKGSVLIEFTDNHEKIVTSRRALRRAV